MSATITIATSVSKGRIIHIEDVDKSIKDGYKCCGCEQDLSPVKTEKRGKDWHFRHLNVTDIVKCRNAALHDYAVQLIIENTRIVITNELTIDYSDPKKEIVIFGKRSDVTVKHNGENVHFEIVVTHDLDESKLLLYKREKIKCIKIDLSDSRLLFAPREEIRKAVLNEYENKNIIYWPDANGAKEINDGSWIRKLFIVLISLIVLNCLRKLFCKPKRRR